MSEHNETGPELDALVTKVVWPAVASLLRPDEFTSLRIDATDQRVTLTLSYGSEEFHDYVYEHAWGDHDLGALRDRLVSHLQDFIAESRLGWGQQRFPDMPGHITSLAK